MLLMLFIYRESTIGLKTSSNLELVVIVKRAGDDYSIGRDYFKYCSLEVLRCQHVN